MSALADPALISKAREAGVVHERYVYRWELLRYSLFSTHLGWSGPQLVVNVGVGNNSAQTKRDNERQLDALTLGDVRQLSTYEMVNWERFEAVRTEVAMVTVPGFGRALPLSIGTFVVELVIAACLMWMWVNVRELSTHSRKYGNV